MMPHKAKLFSDADWSSLCAHSIRDVPTLLARLDLVPEDLGYANPLPMSWSFPLRVPEPYVQKIRPHDPFDPLLLQIVPTAAEAQIVSGFVRDPLNEAGQTPRAGLIHKYAHRILVVVTGACAVHCRYCFRRHFPYADHRVAEGVWQQLDQYLIAHADINEVILSGGDPLSLKEAQLYPLVDVLQRHPQVTRVRIHSRLPVVVPQRVTPALLEWCCALARPVVLVLHVNHANEITDATFLDAMSRLRQQGITLLNQSVLLKGVNDRVDALVALSEALFAAGILPYYLHLLDKVEGSAHFDVSLPTAQSLFSQLLTQLPGYLMPKLVQEIAGAPSKTWMYP
jgi:EF-P beta-lysylation protein EpmB